MKVKKKGKVKEMAEEVTKTEETKTEGTKTEQNKIDENTTTQTEQKVDVEKVKSDALAGFLKELGVEDKDSLKGIITKAKEEEDKNKTELERTSDTLKQTTKLLAEEKELRIMAEAKLSAIQLGAKAELVDDLVIVAKSKVTKDKDINAVITEMKDSESGKIYFKTDDEESTETKTVTRTRVTKQTEKNKTKNSEEETVTEKHTGSMAERLLERRKRTNKTSYFKN